MHSQPHPEQRSPIIGCLWAKVPRMKLEIVALQCLQEAAERLTALVCK